MSNGSDHNARPGTDTENRASRNALRRRILLYLSRLARLLLMAAIYALVVWYGLITTAEVDAPPVPVRIAIAFIALGITGSIYSILAKMATEAKGAIMVLAEFLNTSLLEPHKRRLRAEGYDKGRAEGHTEGHIEGRAEGHTEGRAEGHIEGRAEGHIEGRAEGHTEGRAETLAEVRSALQKAGINLDDYLPPAQEAADTPASRC